jgi:chorismate dehydratase
MADRRLKVGRIPFANLFPIFYTLEKEFDCSCYEFVEGVPSSLNAMLRGGSVDLSPSSSIEYLHNPLLYGYVDGISVSSKGPVGSIFLFSKRPIGSLSGCTIYVTSQSETSIALLQIVLSRFYGVSCPLTVSGNPESIDAEAFLLIGDEALKYNSRIKIKNAKRKDAGASAFVYDLGELWHEKTGLPFVFALWIVQEELYRPNHARHDLFMKFADDLLKAKKESLKNLRMIAGHSPMKGFMSEEAIIDYWNKLDYELSDEHKKGLYLFKDYLS